MTKVTITYRWEWPQHAIVSNGKSTVFVLPGRHFAKRLEQAKEQLKKKIKKTAGS